MWDPSQLIVPSENDFGVSYNTATSPGSPFGSNGPAMTNLSHPHMHHNPQHGHAPFQPGMPFPPPLHMGPPDPDFGSYSHNPMAFSVHNQGMQPNSLFHSPGMNMGQFVGMEPHDITGPSHLPPSQQGSGDHPHHDNAEAPRGTMGLPHLHNPYLPPNANPAANEGTGEAGTQAPVMPYNANRFPLNPNAPPPNLPASFAAPMPFQPNGPFPPQPSPNGLFLPPAPFGNAPGNVLQHPGMNFNPMLMMNRPPMPGYPMQGQRGSASRGRGSRGGTNKMHRKMLARLEEEEGERSRDEDEARDPSSLPNAPPEEYTVSSSEEDLSEDLVEAAFRNADSDWRPTKGANPMGMAMPMMGRMGHKIEGGSLMDLMENRMQWGMPNQPTCDFGQYGAYGHGMMGPGFQANPVVPAFMPEEERLGDEGPTRRSTRHRKTPEKLRTALLLDDEEEVEKIVKASAKPLRKRGRPGRPSLNETLQEAEDDFVTIGVRLPLMPAVASCDGTGSSLSSSLEDSDSSKLFAASTPLSASASATNKPKVFFGSQEPRGEIDHIDHVLDCAEFVAGTDIPYADWRAWTPAKRGDALKTRIEEEKVATAKMTQLFEQQQFHVNEHFLSQFGPFLPPPVMGEASPFLPNPMGVPGMALPNAPAPEAPTALKPESNALAPPKSLPPLHLPKLPTKSASTGAPLTLPKPPSSLTFPASPAPDKEEAMAVEEEEDKDKDKKEDTPPAINTNTNTNTNGPVNTGNANGPAPSTPPARAGANPTQNPNAQLQNSLPKMNGLPGHPMPYQNFPPMPFNPMQYQAFLQAQQGKGLFPPPPFPPHMFPHMLMNKHAIDPQGGQKRRGRGRGRGRPAKEENQPPPKVNLSLINTFSSEVTTETKYLIKWQNWSHIHNSWHTAFELQNLRGYKKVEAFQKAFHNLNAWLSRATQEEQEAAQIELELMKEARARWTKVERVLDERRLRKDFSVPMLPPLDPNAQTPTNTPLSPVKNENASPVASNAVSLTPNGTPSSSNGGSLSSSQDLHNQACEYFVKWQGLSHEECTWEAWKDVKADLPKVEEFRRRLERIELNRSFIGMHSNQSLNFESFTRDSSGVRFNPSLSSTSDIPLEWDTESWMGADKLKKYQVEGVRWMIDRWVDNSNVILADEPGLGKSVQALAFLGWLNHVKNVHGPFLIVTAPTSIAAWVSEIAKWLPNMTSLVYAGPARGRECLLAKEFYFPRRSLSGAYVPNFEILLTTFDVLAKDKAELARVSWNYIVVDEKHLKKTDLVLNECTKHLEFANRMLLLSAPLPPHQKELLSLCNFISPSHPQNKSFVDLMGEKSSDDLKLSGRLDYPFSSLPSPSLLGLACGPMDDTKTAELQQLLAPCFLRRSRKMAEDADAMDVEGKDKRGLEEKVMLIELSKQQRDYYKWILRKNFNEINKASQRGKASILFNIVLDLKRVCNHPTLLEDTEVPPSVGTDTLPTLISQSHKLLVLDQLIRQMQARGERVVVVSHMLKMVDLLETYFRLSQLKCMRYDGLMSQEDRQDAVSKFNESEGDFACLLLSAPACRFFSHSPSPCRASTTNNTNSDGGNEQSLGSGPCKPDQVSHHLTGVSNAVMFDSHWNPRTDSEVVTNMLGGKAVTLYRFLCEDTVEYEFYERIRMKATLDQMRVIHRVKPGPKPASSRETNPREGFSREELLEILRCYHKLFKEENNPSWASEQAKKEVTKTSQAPRDESGQSLLERCLLRAEESLAAARVKEDEATSPVKASPFALPFKRHALDSPFLSPLKGAEDLESPFFQADEPVQSDTPSRHAKIPRVSFSNLDTHVYWTHADVSPRMIKTIAQLPEAAQALTNSPNSLKRKLKEDFAALNDVYPVASKKKLESQLREEMAEENKEDEMGRLLKAHQPLHNTNNNTNGALALTRVDDSRMMVEMKPFQGGQVPYEDDAGEAEEALMAAEALEKEYDDDLPLDCTTPDFTPREIRRIANALLTWPSTGFINEITNAVRLIGRDVDMIGGVVKEIIEAAKRTLDPNGTGLCNKRVRMRFKDTVLDARALYHRVCDMELLASILRNSKGELLREPSQVLALNANLQMSGALPPPWVPFQNLWGPNDDLMIALGVVRYGFGNWDKLRMDTKLNLTYKINTSQAAHATANSNQRSPLPNIAHLNERIAQILAALREARDSSGRSNLLKQQHMAGMRQMHMQAKPSHHQHVPQFQPKPAPQHLPFQFNDYLNSDTL